MPTAAEVVRCVEPAPRPEPPERRILVCQVVDGERRVLYDMPWRNPAYPTDPVLFPACVRDDSDDTDCATDYDTDYEGV